MASGLKFNRKLPSEIQRTEVIPPVETMNRFANAVVSYDNGRASIIWRTRKGSTKAVINEKKLGVAKVYVSAYGHDNWKEVGDAEHVLMASSAMMKLLNTSKGMNWFVTSLNAAKRRWHAAMAA